MKNFQPCPAFPPEQAHRAPPAGHWPPLIASSWGDCNSGLFFELATETPKAAILRFNWRESLDSTVTNPVCGKWIAELGAQEGLAANIVEQINRRAPSQYKVELGCNCISLTPKQ